MLERFISHYSFQISGGTIFQNVYYNCIERAIVNLGMKNKHYR